MNINKHFKLFLTPEAFLTHFEKTFCNAAATQISFHIVVSILYEPSRHIFFKRVVELVDKWNRKNFT